MDMIANGYGYFLFANCRYQIQATKIASMATYFHGRHSFASIFCYRNSFHTIGCCSSYHLQQCKYLKYVCYEISLVKTLQCALQEWCTLQILLIQINIFNKIHASNINVLLYINELDTIAHASILSLINLCV